MNKEGWLLRAVDSVYNRYPNIGHDSCLFAKFTKELSFWWQRTRGVFGKYRLDDDDRHHLGRLTKNYVLGNHRFGASSILSESQWHKLGRKRRADRMSEKRHGVALEREAMVLKLLDDRAGRDWPANAITAQELSSLLKTKHAATGTLNRLGKQGVLHFRKIRPSGGGAPVKHYVHAGQVKARTGRGVNADTPVGLKTLTTREAGSVRGADWVESVGGAIPTANTPRAVRNGWPVRPVRRPLVKGSAILPGISLGPVVDPGLRRTGGGKRGAGNRHVGRHQGPNTGGFSPSAANSSGAAEKPP